MGTHQEIKFDVFPGRKHSEFPDWFELHTREFLKVLCYHFCKEEQKGMDATDRTNSRYWCSTLYKFLHYRSSNQVLWLNIDDSFRT